MSNYNLASVVRIGAHEVGPGCPPYFVAELSANHLQHFERAKQLIVEAARCGANAVKVQLYRPESLTLDCRDKVFRIEEGPWAGQTLFELYSRAAMPWEWMPQLVAVARQHGLALFPTVFDQQAIRLAVELDVPAIKIASFELIDYELLQAAASTGKPLIISTGMASLEEIHLALETVEKAGARQVVLLLCRSSYPAQADQMHLATLVDLRRRFGVPVGLSDHSLTEATAIAAIAMGASMVEKHFTLCRDDGGPDAGFSLEPGEFERMVRLGREAWAAIGHIHYGPTEAEKPMMRFRRSLFVVKEVKKGQLLSRDNVRAIRPGVGLHPKYFSEVLGRRACCDIPAGTPLGWHLIDKNAASVQKPSDHQT